jgi:hypothetical protein
MGITSPTERWLLIQRAETTDDLMIKSIIVKKRVQRVWKMTMSGLCLIVVVILILFPTVLYALRDRCSIEWHSITDVGRDSIWTTTNVTVDMGPGHTCLVQIDPVTTRFDWQPGQDIYVRHCNDAPDTCEWMGVREMSHGWLVSRSIFLSLMSLLTALTAFFFAWMAYTGSELVQYRNTLLRVEQTARHAAACEATSVEPKDHEEVMRKLRIKYIQEEERKAWEQHVEKRELRRRKAAVAAAAAATTAAVASDANIHPVTDISVVQTSNERFIDDCTLEVDDDHSTIELNTQEEES